MSVRLGAVVERAAATASRERPARAVRPGWWVFSYGSAGGEWAQVIAIGLLSKGWVRFELRHLDGRRGLVEASPSHPTSCLTASTARRVGITGGGR